jgi:hypothetical protein
MHPFRKVSTLSLVSALALVLWTVGVWVSPSSAQAAPEPPSYGGGGVWVHPATPTAQWGFGPMIIDVQARNSTQIDHINFTASVPGQGWRTICVAAVNHASGNPTYSCSWDPQAAGVPAATNFDLSFDVYGNPPPDGSPRNLAPNGKHQVSWGWGCIWNPGSGGTCNGW